MATFNLSDVEGEVDHSFFDSDCDDASGDGLGKIDKDLKERSVDADSESSSISSHGTRSIDSPTIPRLNKHPLSPRLRRARAGSAGSGEMPIGPTEESEDTLTDVSHLSSPDTSPRYSVDLNHTDEHQQESVPSSGLNDSRQVQDSDHNVSDYTLGSTSRLGSEVVSCGPGGRNNRKNYSFSNDEVMRIDHENQRLLRVLSLHSSGRRKKANVACKLPPPHLHTYHSTINRKSEEQRIERENLAFLKKLNSIKPTPALKRSEQLKDYQNRHGSSGPGRPVLPRRPTAVTTPTGYSQTPVPRSNKRSAAKAAWC